MSDFLAVIPARYASVRFPGKPLVKIGGKSMIERVYRQVAKVAAIDEVIVATDDERIARHVEEFGGIVRMTSADHPSGTDRVGEVAAQSTARYLINVQGDEPFISPRQIEQLCECLRQPKVEIATLLREAKAEEVTSPHLVKAVRDEAGRALYFSRSLIPFPRKEGMLPYYQHLGIYGFRRETLLKLIKLPVAPLEQAEGLEQLRWLSHGYTIQTALTDLQSISIDTPEDLQQAEAFWEREKRRSEPES
jgi:3-deoxy-manno-octulosonate cytidylyltransferase (CMP-KDO synthetase)